MKLIFVSEDIEKRSSHLIVRKFIFHFTINNILTGIKWLSSDFLFLLKFFFHELRW